METREHPVLVGIDPGPSTSGVVLWQDNRVTQAHSAMPNERVLMLLRNLRATAICEGMQSYGMAVGADVLETCVWTGRYWQASVDCGGAFFRLNRPTVKAFLCGSSTAKDANVRQSLIDIFGGTEGKALAVGRKASPGPLYGVSGHAWSALAVVVAWMHGER